MKSSITGSRGRDLSSAPRLLLTATAVAIASFAIPSAQAAEESQLEEIVVTGSRIEGVTNANSASPVSVITAEDIQKTGATNIEDVLARMVGADFSGGITNASDNGGNGMSVVGMRNLGPSRTLILIDGQRLIGTYSGTTEVIDISSIPVTMVERIEVLRDGASSIYGADAIGGVINIITKKNFEGAQFDATVGKTTHGDGGTSSLAGSLGVNSGKGNVMVTVSRDKISPVQQFDRSWAVDPHQGGPGEGGSTYRSQLDTLQDENSNNIWINNTLYSLTDPAAAAFLPNDVYLQGGQRLKLNAGAPGWNYLTQGLDRKQISINSHYDLSDYATFVAEGFFTDRNSQGSLRPEPLLGDTIAAGPFAGFYIPSWVPGYPTGDGYDDPGFAAFLTPGQFGPRRYEADSFTYRIHTGLEGKFGDGYRWEGGFIDQHNTTNSLTKNEGNFEHLAQITGLIDCIDVPGGCQTVAPTATPDGSGKIITSIPNVSPNWFAGPNGIFTPAQLAYLTWTNTDRRTSLEQVAYADVNGPLFALPAGTVKGALGAEHRKEFLADTPDILVQEGWGPNQSTPTAGGYHVSSVYAEVNAPLLQDQPFASELTADLSGRYDKYSTFGTSKTYKFGLEYSPLQDVRFRGSISTGFRAPNVAELYGGTAISDLTGNGDPCDTRAAGYNGNSNVGQGVLTAGSTCSVAVANGAAVTNFQSGNNNQTAQQQQVVLGGNPNLGPEKSHNRGIGVVVTPRVVKGLSITADYYKIRISNTVLTSGVVGATSVDTVLLGCYGSQQNTAYCSLIARNGAGTITQISSVADNFGVARVSGIDYGLQYDTQKAGLEMPFPGNFMFDLEVSRENTNTQSNADGTISDFNGAFQLANEAIEPKWKGLATLEYSVGAFTAHWDTRYTGHMISFDGSPPPSDKLPNVYYQNVSGSYKFSSTPYFKDTMLVLGINNLLDKDPPFLSSDSICKCNTLAGPYDVLGRYVYARISAKF